MANTYTQLYIHFVFAVKFRQAVLLPAWEARVQRYITGIVQKNDHKLLAIESVPDHLHLFVGLNPMQSISTLMQLVKGDSAEFVNDNKFTDRKFQWQSGYGAFSHSRSQLDAVVRYINRQKEHHSTKTFREEYLELLKLHGIDYNERYIFHDLLNE